MFWSWLKTFLEGLADVPDGLPRIRNPVPPGLEKPPPPPAPPPRKPVFPPNQMLSEGALRMRTESSAGRCEASPPPSRARPEVDCRKWFPDVPERKEDPPLPIHGRTEAEIEEDSKESWAWISKQVFPLHIESGDRVTIAVDHRDGRKTRFEF